MGDDMNHHTSGMPSRYFFIIFGCLRDLPLFRMVVYNFFAVLAGRRGPLTSLPGSTNY